MRGRVPADGGKAADNLHTNNLTAGWSRAGWFGPLRGLLATELIARLSVCHVPVRLLHLGMFIDSEAMVLVLAVLAGSGRR